ncbi:hypothetical protein E2562_023974 [Oryza meyeriana var. granulata]|uniref:FAE domain-containing protein n=1 Tax=Oryza meyeriana var. granulata TaxID=110450 RepID=A0A6G1C166_9ORYZ|nr:hypothetical protein E2562_023974 [Oryza meyeriana var. granulata]
MFSVVDELFAKCGVSPRARDVGVLIVNGSLPLQHSPILPSLAAIVPWSSTAIICAAVHLVSATTLAAWAAVCSAGILVLELARNVLSFEAELFS